MENNLNTLEIIIPTYNRKKRLINMLKSIEREKERVKITIIDNNSNYNIEEIYQENFQYLDIRIKKNKVNIGMIGNFCKCFYVCESKWLWILSDDDEIVEGAFKNIKQILSDNQDIDFFKFSTEGIGESGIEKEEKVENIEQFIDHYYYDSIYKGGQMVFISNNIFNMNKIRKYLDEVYSYSYIYVPHLIPIFFGLAKKEIKVLFSNRKIVRYIPPNGDHWDVLKVCLGVSTVSHLSLNLDQKYLKRFIKIFNWISLEWLFKSILKNKNKNGLYYFSLLYNSLYKYHLSFKDKLKYPIYKFFIYLNEKIGIDFYESLKKIKMKLKRK